MTSPPSEPYFADGLLERLYREHPRLRNVLSMNLDRRATATGAIVSLVGVRHDVADRALTLLCEAVSVELAGARRAREKAGEFLKERNGAEWHRVARQILEAFDAK